MYWITLSIFLKASIALDWTLSNSLKVLWKILVGDDFNETDSGTIFLSLSDSIGAPGGFLTLFGWKLRKCFRMGSPLLQLLLQ